MHMPYMRIAIYALTFLTYAYSGHGSHMLANLRDALIAAEAVFGDVCRNAIYVARKFQTVHEVFDAAADETCTFRCPNAAVVPVRNRMHTPTADGCGSAALGGLLASEYLPVAEMNVCCDRHDICYDTCGRDKELCDIEFKRCLYAHCDPPTGDGDAPPTLLVAGCKGAAKMMFTATLTLGCRAYLDAQAKACYCAPNGGPQPKKAPADGRRTDDQAAYGKQRTAGRTASYPNNVPQSERTKSYGWKDKRDL